MELGMVQVMPSFGWQGVSDQQVYDEEVRQAVLADELGYDHLWVV
ncbi:MAG: LLM class flavin-dependent oxidoreductase, partial [Acetobacteraceae bacterium]|nr:LLM class flavin-dependent oxidoreductase [Acetobacteraceae bacterium]